MIYDDFFGFDEFYSKLLPNISSLSTLLSSHLFEPAEEARETLFNLISSCYDDTIAHKCVQTLEPYNNNLRDFNESLNEINKYLGEPVREMRIKLS